MDNKSKNIIYSYWGKVKDDNSYHLLPYHCLDVSAVAKAYLDTHPEFCCFLAQCIGLPNDVLEKIALFFIAIHDLGKFSESFQNLVPEVLTLLQNKTSNKGYSIKHDTLGFLLWKKMILALLKEQGWITAPKLDEDELESYEEGLDFLARATTGHHGEPPKEEKKIIKEIFSDTDLQAVTDFLHEVGNIFLAPLPILPICKGDDFCHKAQDISWWLAGLTVLADWLGSDIKYFPYVSKAMPLHEYWEHACISAKKALQDIKLDCFPIIKEQTFTGLFAKAKPTPLQQAAWDLPLFTGQQLFILEDLTGSGKTEAALILAQRLLKQGNGYGFYFGLPTMATSNAMYKRVHHYCSALFNNSDEISLMLTHGKSNLNDHFKITMRVQEKMFKKEDLPATIGCNAWFADSRKKALLTQLGVGTIDQSLQAILPNKHQSLRLLGLFGKVLIVDEVHACDAYMNSLLKKLLSFHAASGGSAILLSATLPQKTRQELVKAFKAFYGDAQVKVTLQSDAYPLLTQASQEHFVEKPIATNSAAQRTVFVELKCNKLEVIEKIKQALGQGACVCWIRNTVSDAIACYQELKNELSADKIILFHARFTVGDRNHYEDKILNLFGEKSQPEQRCGKLVIATQVVEQSLDIDFDFMVSDLAPIDLLIQRAGRLQRHKRVARVVATPTLLVYGPKPIEGAKGNWYKEFFPKASYVYENHGQLWLTAKIIEERGKFILPEDARYLIENVYADDLLERIPEGLQEKTNQAEGTASAEKSLARLYGLSLHEGYKKDGMDWWEDIFAPTRLGEKMIILRLAKWQDQKLVPWHENDSNWNLSQVNVNYHKIKQRKPIENPELEKIVTEVENSLPDKGKWSVLLPLKFDQEKNIWFAQADNENGKEVMVVYDKIIGLVYD